MSKFEMYEKKRSKMKPIRVSNSCIIIPVSLSGLFLAKGERVEIGVNKKDRQVLLKVGETGIKISRQKYNRTAALQNRNICQQIIKDLQLNGSTKALTTEWSEEYQGWVAEFE